MENDKYKELFFEESDEYLEILNDRILVLEDNPDDRGIIDEIFRSAHTLKGMAATMGYEDMSKLTHGMENIFELFRSKKMDVSTDIINLIFKCLDRLSDIVEDLRSGNSGEKDISDLLKEIESIQGKKDVVINKTDYKIEEKTISESDLNVIAEAKRKGYEAYDVVVEISKECMLKGPRAFLVITKIKNVGELLSSFPSIEDLQNGEYDNKFRLIILSKENINKMQSVLENNVEVEKVLISKVQESINNKADIKKSITNNKKIKKNKKNLSKGQSIKVQLDKLDSFMNLVSELAIYGTRLEDINSRITNNEMEEPLKQVSKITSDLQDLVLSIRMEAVSVVFNRFPRMIRDLSQDLGKNMKLVIEGENTELDRTVVSELGEPLVHLIRNAADHGIETKEERLKQGKSEEGTITLKAYQEGNKVVIQVKDDGAGINPKIIKKSAEKKGINTDGLSDQEIIELIFSKGFSTNKSVTSLSGRGVGMDVVKQKISSLSGTLNLVSEVGKGSVFTIRLPLSLLIIQALLVKVGEEVFAISLEIIERVITVRKENLKTSHVGEFYILGEDTIPVIRLSDKFNLKSKCSTHYLILVLVDNKKYGVIIDDFIGQQDIVIKELGNSLKGMNDFIGATILGSGEIILIVDIINIILSIKDDGIYEG